MKKQVRIALPKTLLKIHGVSLSELWGNGFSRNNGIVGLCVLWCVASLRSFFHGAVLRGLVN